MPVPRPKQKRSKLHSLYLWHRYLGLAAALLVALLSITGILLNHTENLQLDSRYMQTEWLLRWYGIQPPTPLSYSVPIGYISQLGEHLYLNQHRIATEPGLFQGAVAGSSEFLLAAYSEKLLLLTWQGEIVEKLDSASGVPSNIKQVGLGHQGKIFLRTAEGKVYQAHPALLDWQLAADGALIRWATTSPTPESLQLALAHDFRGMGLSWERTLLDLHSGRIWGAWGIYFMDAAALLFLLLATSGVWVWGIRRLKQQSRTKGPGRK